MQKYTILIFFVCLVSIQIWSMESNQDKLSCEQVAHLKKIIVAKQKALRYKSHRPHAIPTIQEEVTSIENALLRHEVHRLRETIISKL